MSQPKKHLFRWTRGTKNAGESLFSNCGNFEVLRGEGTATTYRVFHLYENGSRVWIGPEFATEKAAKDYAQTENER